MKKLKQYNINYYLITVILILLCIPYFGFINFVINLTDINYILYFCLILFVIVTTVTLIYLLYFAYAFNMRLLIKDNYMITNFTELHESLYVLTKELSKKSQFRLDYPLIALLHFKELIALRKFDEVGTYCNHTKNNLRLHFVIFPTTVLDLCILSQDIESYIQYFESKPWRRIRKSNVLYNYYYFYFKKDYASALAQLNKIKPSAQPLSIQNENSLLGKIYYRTNRTEELNKIMDEIKSYPYNPAVRGLEHLINTGEEYVENVPVYLITNLTATINHKPLRLFIVYFIIMLALIGLLISPIMH
ncbi:hypothetical protein [Anaerorhabdus sp.]|uniref:hypothetical protein n=1 Tax=Anaerorhabdus sp. TaxID=1872524 RepID=UPI002B2132F7|nr:hypothetical protein [Anaerorhabdus sp.]MEA4876151.1 hypothetical protein [Anaerorhabdus sp.]